jgi:hypothetical protein
VHNAPWRDTSSAIALFKRLAVSASIGQSLAKSAPLASWVTRVPATKSSTFLFWQAPTRKKAGFHLISAWYECLTIKKALLEEASF